jgi:two-component system, OmpR family, KDP operon response regulator KdpE
VTRVLVVDDEPQLLRALRINLRARHYDVETAPDGAAALAAAARRPPDAVILDLGLPDLDGTEVIEGLRGWTRVPIIVLSGRDDTAGKVGALDAGADDYVTKPFSMDELLARLRSALRRTDVATAPPSFRIGSYEIDLAAHTIMAHEGGGEAPAMPRVRLTPTEWGILEILLRNAGKLVTSRQLLREVWGPRYQRETHYLRFYLARLRRKLEPDPSRPRYLITEPGMGYRYIP